MTSSKHGDSTLFGAKQDAGESARLDRMTRLLRVLGAAFLLASASTFLLRQWQAGNDVLRYGFLLAHAVLLLGAALFCGGKLGASRSARIFLWTSTAMVPVFFGVLGGLVYSQFGLDKTATSLPNYALWQAPSPLAAVLCVIGTFAIVVPSSFVALRVLARRQAVVLLVTYLGLNTLFLVPVRSADWIGAMSLAGCYLSLALERGVLSKDYSMRTLEGRLVRGLLWAPSALLTLRTLVFYEPTTVFVGLIVLFSGVCALIATRGLEEKSEFRAGLEWASSLVVAYGVLHTIMGFDLKGGSLLFLPSCLALVVCSFFTWGARNALEITASVLGCLVCGLAIVSEGGMMEGALGLAVGALVLASSVLLGRGSTGIIGAILVLLSARLVFDLAIGFERILNWGTLSAMGMVLLFSAAIFEKHRHTVLSWMRNRRAALRHPSALG